MSNNLKQECARNRIVKHEKDSKGLNKEINVGKWGVSNEVRVTATMVGERVESGNWEESN